ACGSCEASGDAEGVSEVFDGAEGDHLVSLRDGLGTCVLYIDVRQCKRAHNFAKEDGFLVVGLDEGEGDGGSPEFDRNSREAGAGAEVGEADSGASLRRTAGGGCPHRSSGGEEVTRGEEGFAEVAGDDFFGVADGGEVDAGIPADEYIDVCRYMLQLGGGQDSGFLVAALL